uniref:Connective tissue growth factor n=1 Tax=Ciona intestinalis TaxID=7719 RepID=F6RI21_CIOIN
MRSTSFLIYSLSLVAAFLHFVSIVNGMCPLVCDCSNAPTRCPSGVSLVTDGCNCCKVCAKQTGEECNDQEKVCDPHRDLFCDYSGSRSGDWGVCRAQDGRPCVHEGTRISSGTMFQPTCKLRCWCMDGADACTSLCPHEIQVPLPHVCPHARLQPIPGQCCSAWVCDAPSGESAVLPMDRFWNEYVSEHEPTDISTVIVCAVSTSSFASSVTRGRSLAGNRKSGCRQQASMWSYCTKSCGLGVSTRVSNANAECKLRREVRLCEVRSCNQEESLTPKHGRRCMKQRRAPRKEHIVYSGCTSVRSYRPRHCGLCKNGRCCTPRSTRTTTVRFECEDGRAFYKRMMVIKSCKCHRHC